MNALPRSLAVAVMAAAAPWLVAPATAAPTSSPLALHSAVGSSVEVVQYRRGFRRGYRGRGFGGVGVGLGIAGAIVGGAIIASQPRGYYGYGGYDPGYGGYGPGYDQGYVAVSPDAGDNEVAYCQQRFRSYDLRSGTYLGFDGLRHPCP
jgi:hypothetical protein